MTSDVLDIFTTKLQVVKSPYPCLHCQPCPCFQKLILLCENRKEKRKKKREKKKYISSLRYWINIVVFRPYWNIYIIPVSPNSRIFVRSKSRQYHPIANNTGTHADMFQNCPILRFQNLGLKVYFFQKFQCKHSQNSQMNIYKLAEQF